jgi:hypothetical protein
MSQRQVVQTKKFSGVTRYVTESVVVSEVKSSGIDGKTTVPTVAENKPH